MTPPALVSVRDLGKVYEPASRWFRFVLRSQISAPVRALHAITFEVRAGEVCVVAGANGAGKSTLFRVLIGLVAPTTGSASIVGMDATHPSPDLARAVGFAPADDRTLHLRNTVYDNLVFRGRLHRLRAAVLEKRIDDVLETVGLADVKDRVGFALSAGMRARLQLASALLHDPPVLILDEPTESVDPVGSYHLLNQIRSIAAQHEKAVLISSHRIDEIEALGEHVALLRRGKLVHWGRLSDLGEPGGRRIVIRWRPTASAIEAAERLRNVEGVILEAIDTSALTVTTTLDTGELLTHLDGELRGVSSVEEGRPPVREVLVSAMTAEDAPAEEQQ